MNCQTCRFVDFAILDGVDDDNEHSELPHMICRRFPPSMLMDPGGAAGVLWPLVHGDDWCGEWQLSPTAPPERDVDLVWDEQRIVGLYDTVTGTVLTKVMLEDGSELDLSVGYWPFGADLVFTLDDGRVRGFHAILGPGQYGYSTGETRNP